MSIPTGRFTSLIASLSAALMGGSHLAAARADAEPGLRTLSSRPDMVSGGDVLVEVDAPSQSIWTVKLDGRDVTAWFHPATGSGRPVALLNGLELGKNVLTLRIMGSITATLEILNHPVGGPILSGPHQTPFICQTEANGLGPALDSDCNAKTIVQYYYKSTETSQEPASEGLVASRPALAPGFKPYDEAGSPPGDVAKTVTFDGRTVNYIVRREVGVINRAVFDIQFLHQPGESLPSPWASRTTGWNGRLVYSFGGGCAAGYRQGKPYLPIGLQEKPFLEQGYALATSSLNIFATNCNDRVSVETALMVKEHFIKQYGNPIHTIGWGGSGGSIQQYLVAQNYPGLLDGIIPFIGFPDVLNAVQSTSDCSLLDRAFTTSTQPWTAEQKAAVSGFATWRTCLHQGESIGKVRWLDPRECDLSLSKDKIYDRSANPTGVRCDVYDNEINVFGRDPRTGFARRPLDNIGVQYGLVAFNLGIIDAEHFVELNERVGGHDSDGLIVNARSDADPESIRLTYRRGLVLTGGGDLGRIPIIDWRWYADDLVDDGHDRSRSFITRARLIAANGNADNQVMLLDPRTDVFSSSNPNSDARSLFEQRIDFLVREMDRWLDMVAADKGAGTYSTKVARNKPPDLTDACWKVNGERIAEGATYDGPGRCNELYPSHGNPRIAAGGPLTDDVLKCELKPVNGAGYAQSLSADQLARLRAIFPAGVCDYTRAGVGQQVTKTTWQKY
jgi:hypothetical protein